MARNDTFKLLRTTRANLNTQAAANNLVVGEPYYITDEKAFAIGTAVNTYQVFDKETVSSSNGNGHYTMFPDGTQICRNFGMSWSTNDTVTFPVAFIDTNYSLALNNNSAADRLLASNTKTTTNFKVRVQDAAAAFVSLSGAAEYIAIGRWKAY